MLTEHRQLNQTLGLPEVLEPSEGDTKKRRVESFDESVDWFQKEKVNYSMDDECFG